MIIKYTDEFKKRFYELPVNIQRMFRKQETKSKDNLHTKKLEGDPITFSFRITRTYRALFFFEDAKVAIFATIGHRKDVYRKR